MTLFQNIKRNLGRQIANDKIVSKSEVKVQDISSDASSDISVACKVVDKLYSHVSRCINGDLSDVKMNLFEKSAISGGLQRMLPGTKKYITGMSKKDVKLLLDDIEAELVKRK